jgi:hypothetical protein
LLDRYPVVVAEEEANETESNLAEIGTQREMTPTNVVDLDQWIIAVDESNAGREMVNDPQLEGELLALEVAAAAEEVPSHESEEATICILTHQRAPMPWLSQATSTTQLAFEFA